MSEYALITDYGGRGYHEDISVEFFEDKRALNKHVDKILSEITHWNQYDRTICKVVGCVDYSKAKNYSKVNK
jgi:hypothetical protein